MPVFALDDNLIFPHPVLREADGLLAVGGDLSPERLLLAYRWGIFPWYSEGQPILWYWSCPRPIVRTADVHVSHSVRNFINQKHYTVTMDTAFDEVVHQCSSIHRPGQEGGTWITHDMKQAYSALHASGHAHSIEVWSEDELCGGLYGVWLGNIFSGESMFSKKPNASKVGFVWLCNYLAQHGCAYVDCQQDTPYMRTFGSFLMGEEEYLAVLRKNQTRF
jgi:leucyl/phenylalanyl-tRNA--protein transferase